MEYHSKIHDERSNRKDLSPLDRSRGKLFPPPPPLATAVILNFNVFGGAIIENVVGQHGETCVGGTRGHDLCEDRQHR